MPGRGGGTGETPAAAGAWREGRGRRFWCFTERPNNEADKAIKIIPRSIDYHATRKAMNWTAVWCTEKKKKKMNQEKKKKVPGERRITLGVESRGISKIQIDGMARNDQMSRKVNAE